MKSLRQLTLFDTTIIMVSFVIGMGIFRTPVNVAQAVTSPAMFFGAWIAGGIVALCGALTYAEIGSRLPVTGGYYKVFAYAYHPSIAFAVNCIILVSNAASLAAVALVGGEYITGVLLPLLQKNSGVNSFSKVYVQTVQVTIAIGAIVIFYGVGLFGLKMSARAQNILMLVKITMVLLLISPLFFSTGTATVLPHITGPASPILSEYLKAFGTGLVAVSFTYGGYQQTINFGEEVHNPCKTVPRAIFMGIIIILVLYLAINYAYVKVIGFEELKTSKNIAAIMAGKIFGINAERILSVLLFMSVLGYVNILLMSNPRVMAAMSYDKILPDAFGKRHPVTGVLTSSLTAFAVICVIIIFWAKEFDTILSFTIFLDCFGMVFSAGSIFKIRKHTAHLPKDSIYSMKLFPLLPLVFMAAYTFVGISIFVTETKTSLVALGVLAVFIIIYFLIAGKNSEKQASNGL